MRNKIMVFEVNELKHDVPVDRAHVEQLKRSLKERGQIAPILVWSNGADVIDGFHRITALQELAAEGCDWAQIRASVLDCDKDCYQDARILSACMHKSVSFARVTMWVQEMFLATKWADRLKASEAFHIGGKRGEYISQKHFEQHWYKGGTPLTGDELFEIAKWVQAKADTWGLSSEQIANMLALAEIASPMLIPMVSERQSRRDAVLTRPMLNKIASLIPDHSLQEAVAKKARAERLGEQETQELVESVITATPEALPVVLTTNWIDQRPIAPAIPQMKADEQLAMVCEVSARGLQRHLTDLTSMKVESSMEALNGVLAGLVITIARYRGTSEDVSEYLQSELARLTRENKVLRGEVGRLEGQVRGMEKLLKTGREMYRQDTS